MNGTIRATRPIGSGRLKRSDIDTVDGLSHRAGQRAIRVNQLILDVSQFRCDDRHKVSNLVKIQEASRELCVEIEFLVDLARRLKRIIAIEQAKQDE